MKIYVGMIRNMGSGEVVDVVGLFGDAGKAQEKTEEEKARMRYTEPIEAVVYPYDVIGDVPGYAKIPF